MNGRLINGISFYSFDLFAPWPELTVGAFGRGGGVSPAPYDSLNISLAVPDDPQRVVANRERMAHSVGWEPGRIVSARQVHGTHVAVATREMAGGSELPGTDALVTDEPGLLLMLKFADCVPVVMWDPVRRVVALVHAGWRGTVAGAPAATLEFMMSRYGSQPGDVLAGIGPSIGPCCYQVGREVATQAEQVFAGAGVVSAGPDGTPHFDLWAANAETLMRAGVSEEKIAVGGICTRCRNDLFFSHRASGSPSGRFAVVAGIRDE
jgi:YfiH family protein